MTDRELLESAARAAGYVLLTNGQAYSQDAGNFDWNPLTDDGDALRLAVHMFRDIHFWYFDNSVSVGNERRVVCDSDPCAATRRAIVAAAALVGEQLETKP
jgi:hypothetical protein